MGKFDSIKMQDLVEVKDPDEDGGVTPVSYTHLTLPTKA